MAHYARVQDGMVVDVHVLVNSVITNGEGVEVEALGQSFLSDLWGGDAAEYVQCSNNGTMRGVYPGAGYTWDGSVFAPPFVPEPEPIESEAP